MKLNPDSSCFEYIQFVAKTAVETIFSPNFISEHLHVRCSPAAIDDSIRRGFKNFLMRTWSQEKEVLIFQEVAQKIGLRNLKMHEMVKPKSLQNIILADPYAEWPGESIAVALGVLQTLVI